MKAVSYFQGGTTINARILAKMRSTGLDRLIFAVIFIYLCSRNSQLLSYPILN